MLSSITPLGERGRNNRFWVTGTWFVAGAVAGGITTGAIAGGAGRMVDAAVDLDANWVLALAGGLAAAAALADRRGRLRSVHRQVDEDWLTRYRGWVYGVGFGYQLGLGVVTIVTTAAVYLWIALAFLTGSPLAGAFVGAVFGAVRGGSIVLARDARDHSRTSRLLQRVDARRATATRVAIVGEVVIATAAFALLLVNPA